MSSRRLALFVVVALVVASSMNLVGLIIVFARSGQQARDGARARVTQCDREPVTRKLAEAAFAFRQQLPSNARITPGELARFVAQAPRDCP